MQILEPAVSWSFSRYVVESAAASLEIVVFNIEGLLDSNDWTGPEEEIGRDMA